MPISGRPSAERQDSPFRAWNLAGPDVAIIQHRILNDAGTVDDRHYSCPGDRGLSKAAGAYTLLLFPYATQREDIYTITHSDRSALRYC